MKIMYRKGHNKVRENAEETGRKEKEAQIGGKMDWERERERERKRGRERERERERERCLKISEKEKKCMVQ